MIGGFWLFASVSSAAGNVGSSFSFEPRIGHVGLPGLEVRSASGSRRRWTRPAKTGCDPLRTFALSDQSSWARLMCLIILHYAQRI